MNHCEKSPCPAAARIEAEMAGVEYQRAWGNVMLCRVADADIERYNEAHDSFYHRLFGMVD